MMNMAIAPCNKIMIMDIKISLHSILEWSKKTLIIKIKLKKSTI